MQSISSLFPTIDLRTLVKPQDRRKQLIKQFVEAIQKDSQQSKLEAQQLQWRTGIKQKIWPVPTARIIAIKLGHLKEIHDLEWLLGQCRESKHFSRCFYGSLKVINK